MKPMTPKKTIDGIKVVLYDPVRKKELKRQIISLQSAIYLIATII